MCQSRYCVRKKTIATTNHVSNHPVNTKVLTTYVIIEMVREKNMPQPCFQRNCTILTLFDVQSSRLCTWEHEASTSPLSKPQCNITYVLQCWKESPANVTGRCVCETTIAMLFTSGINVLMQQYSHTFVVVLIELAKTHVAGDYCVRERTPP
jgi:hypothetical protein